MTRLVVPIESDDKYVKSNKISQGFTLAKGLMVLELSEVGVVVDAFSLNLGKLKEEDLLDVLMGLDVDLVLSKDIEPELAEFLVNNNVKIALTKSKELKDALRDLLSGKVKLIPDRVMPIKYAN
ncbi:MAG: hypothetical protein J7J65_06065 [Candidatus Korarchaeota archaeon]|nr:hypothetical protein [Candidatus Korarchaeota archaeon]